MKKCFLLFLSLFLLSVSVQLWAQEKLFEPEDYLNHDLYPKRMSNISWRGDTDNFTFIAKNSLVQKSAETANSTDTILRLSDLNSRLEKLRIDDLSRFPSVTWLDGERFLFTAKSKVFVFDFSQDTLIKVNEYPEDAENVNLDETTFSVAYTLENNLYVALDGEQIPVTEEKDKNIVYGHIVSRNEFGINRGSYWSPDGKLLAFYRDDRSEVTDYPLVDINHRIAEEDPIKYPMAGMKSEHLKVGVFNPEQNEIVYLNTPGPEFQYLTNISWCPESKYVFIAVLNRDQNHLKLNKYDASTGEFIKTLFEEKNEKYVEPLHGLYFLKTNPDLFIWQSRRDGWNHLYLYDIDGKLIRQLTSGEWVVTNLLGLDKDEKNVFFISTKESPIERQVYKTDIKKGKIEKITKTKGTHYAIINERGDYFIDILSSTEVARDYSILDKNGKKIQTLLEDKNPWKDYKLGEMSIFTIKAADEKTDLYCRLIKPVDFDPSKKYPVLVYVYGGPHAQLVTDSWTGGAGFFLNYMAQKGYVVFTLDNRGSANRGFEFESVIFRNLGYHEMADQMKGVEYLKSLDFVDADKIGVDGWSYGGFMTISLLLRNPGVFSVACAGGPVIDWKFYEVMYGERYMDTPMKNSEGYKESCLFNYIDRFDGKLLIIQGTSDPTVVWQNSLTFLEECIKQGKQVDYFVYPGAGHNMHGKSRVHLYRKISNYFDDYLKK